jgi:monofunctional glycosyltransferase
MRWFIYPFKCLLFGFLAMQAYFAIQIGLWTTINPDSTAFQRAERWRLCTWHWTCPIQSKWTPYDKISGNLKRAVLVSEDDIFFQHKGVRVEDMQKAWEKNQQKNRSGKQAKTALRGGSTITQQLAKIYFYLLSKIIFVRRQELINYWFARADLYRSNVYSRFISTL